MYLPHDNVGKVDQFLDFPKKAFALKQNPKAFCAFHEGRVIFQRLADQFWPGPVLLYLQPHTPSLVPRALLLEQNGQHQNGDHFTPNKPFIGFRCPSHPLTVKVVRQVHDQDERRSAPVMVGSPVMAAPVPPETVPSASSLTPDNNSNITDSNKNTNKNIINNSNSGSTTDFRLLCRAKEVSLQYAQMVQPSHHGPATIATTTTTTTRTAPCNTPNQSCIQVLQGEEKREIFAVPTCQFRDEWLECWIVQESRSVVLRGKSSRTIPQLQQLLHMAPTKNRVVRSVLGQWKVVDQRETLKTKLKPKAR